jgi:integrase
MNMEMEKFEQEVEDYLKSKGKHTAEIYSSGFRAFVEYYRPKHDVDNPFGHFLDRIFEDIDKPPREQKRIAEAELTEYIKFLKKKPLKTNPNKTLSNNAIRLYLAAMQDFLKYMRIIVSAEFISDIPPPNGKKENEKHEWEIEQIKEFVDTAESYRDKALIACIFQSGLGDSEICDLNYGDIKDELEAGTLPLCMHLFRHKTDVEFKSFFGRDAVKYLKLYLATRGELKPEDPLFTKQRTRGGEERINPSTIQQTFSEIAKNLSFIKQKKDAYNPARPHSLRAAFNSQLISIANGQLVNIIDETLRKFWMGHDIGVKAKAYLAMPTEKMRRLYMIAEEFLKIEKSSQEELDEISKAKGVVPPALEEKVEALEKKVVSMAILEQKVASLETLYNKLFEMKPEELRLLLQEIDRLLHQRQKAEDKRQFSSS